MVYYICSGLKHENSHEAFIEISKSSLKKLGAWNIIIVFSLFHMKMSGKLRTEAGADETSILTVVFLGDIAHQLFYNCSRTVIQQNEEGKKWTETPKKSNLNVKSNIYAQNVIQLWKLTIFVNKNLDSGRTCRP